jgi:hypothetical protein
MEFGPLMAKFPKTQKIDVRCVIFEKMRSGRENVPRAMFSITNPK